MYLWRKEWLSSSNWLSLSVTGCGQRCRNSSSTESVAAAISSTCATVIESKLKDLGSMVEKERVFGQRSAG